MERHLYKAKTTKKENPKSIFNNVWVEGDLIISAGKYYIHPRGNAVSVEGEIGKLIVMHEVDPVTICQCTGYTGIWENDIIQYDGELFWIEYDEEEKAWSAVWKDDYVELGELLMDEITVIGNKFDDPELTGV